MKVYCVEDDEAIREIVVYTLHSTGFDAEGFSDGKEFFSALNLKENAIQRVNSKDSERKLFPDLILLDIMLPGEDGLQILKKLRNDIRTRQIPVIMLTAKGTEFDKVTGLDLGADDYVIKPFGMMELVSRIRAVLRRSEKKPEKAEIIKGKVKLFYTEHRVTVDDRDVSLTPKEFQLLNLLMEHQGIVFSREQLLSQIWGFEYYGETRTVDVHIRSLRSKLGSAADIIETIRGIGYKIKK